MLDYKDTCPLCGVRRSRDPGHRSYCAECYQHILDLNAKANQERQALNQYIQYWCEDCGAGRLWTDIQTDFCPECGGQMIEEGH